MTTDGVASGGGFTREPAPVGWPAGRDSASEPPASQPTAPQPATQQPPSAAPPVNPAAAPNPAAPLTRGPVTSPPSPAPVAAPPRPAYQTAARTTVTEASRKGGRKARLTLKRIDPWSVLKFSFVYSIAGLVVLLVAVIALYAIVDAMGVIDSIRSFLHDVEGTKNGGGVAAWLTFGRIFSISLVVGLINVILFTAFATLTAFIYNVCTDLVGGIEVTLAERG